MITSQKHHKKHLLNIITSKTWHSFDLKRKWMKNSKSQPSDTKTMQTSHQNKVNHRNYIAQSDYITNLIIYAFRKKLLEFSKYAEYLKIMMLSFLTSFSTQSKVLKSLIMQELYCSGSQKLEHYILGVWNTQQETPFQFPVVLNGAYFFLSNSKRFSTPKISSPNHCKQINQPHIVY